MINTIKNEDKSLLTSFGLLAQVILQDILYRFVNFELHKNILLHLIMYLKFNDIRYPTTM